MEPKETPPPDTPAKDAAAGPSLADVMAALTALSDSSRKQQEESVALRSSVQQLQYRLAMGPSGAASPARSTAATPRSASPSEDAAMPDVGRRLTDSLPHLEEIAAAAQAALEQEFALLSPAMRESAARAGWSPADNVLGILPTNDPEQQYAPWTRAEAEAAQRSSRQRGFTETQAEAAVAARRASFMATAAASTAAPTMPKPKGGVLSAMRGRTSNVAPSLPGPGPHAVPQPSSAVSVTTTRLQDSFEHIVLKTLTIEAVLTWTQDIENYEARTSIPLQVGLRVSQSVMRSIMARFSTSMPTEATFYHLPDAEIHDALQEILRPASKVEFSECLEKLLHFKMPRGFILSGTTFVDFYPLILVYNQRFRKLLAYMSYDNSLQLPQMRYTRPGLIYYYLNAIPFRFGWSIYSSIEKRRYADMEEFLIAFMVPLEAMYRQAIKWKGYATIIDFQSSLEPSRADEQPAERYGSGPRGPAPIPTRPAPRLHNLEAHAAGTPAYDGQVSPYQPAGWEEFPDHEFFDDDAAHEDGDEESSYKTPHDERAGDPDEGEDSCLPANHR
jgi:hypothetical protein